MNHRTFPVWLSLSVAASGCCSDNRSSERSPLTPGFLPSSEPAGTWAVYPLPHPWALDHTKVGSGGRSRAHCDEATKSPLVLSTATYARFARGNHKDNKLSIHIWDGWLERREDRLLANLMTWIVRIYNLLIWYKRTQKLKKHFTFGNHVHSYTADLM